MKRIVLDLTQVSYLDSSGIGTMVRLWISARKAGCEFKVRNLSPRLKDLFTMTNLASMFGDTEQP
jgi:anti-sigma B factor antagonist